MTSSKPTVRPATAVDIAAFTSMREIPTLRAWCMDLDGKIIALGGVAVVKGRNLGFVDLTAEARKFKVHIARAAIRFLAEMRRQGVRFIYVEADPSEPRARTWLASLGFETDPRTGYLFRWRAK